MSRVGFPNSEAAPAATAAGFEVDAVDVIFRGTC